MTQQQALHIFEDKKVRTIWDDEQEKWYFSIVDTIGILTESKDPTAYWRKLKTTSHGRGKSNRDKLSRFQNEGS